MCSGVVTPDTRNPHDPKYIIPWKLQYYGLVGSCRTSDMSGSEAAAKA